MLAKAIRNRPINQVDPDHFRARVDYICGKATQVVLINLAGDWLDAKKQMTAAAALTPRLRYPAYHLVLSWAETERPTDAEMIMAAKAVLNDIGAAEHQCVLATHRDRIDLHVHAVVNRAHPTGGQTLSVSHDYARLEAACRRVEHQMGWPQDRGRFDMQIDGNEVVPMPKPAGHWLRRSQARAAGRRMDGQAVRNERRGSGRPSLRQSLTDKAVVWLRGALEQAVVWAEAHKACRRIGLRYIRYGTGARILRAADGAHMPAGQLGSGFSHARMTARLGSFQDGGPERRIVGMHDAKALRDGDIATPSPLSLEPSTRGVRNGRQHASEALRAALKRERQQITVALRGTRSMAAQAVRMVLKDRQRMDRDMHRHRLRRDRIAEETEAPPVTSPSVDQARIATPGGGEDIHDHTSARQAWILSSGTAERARDVPFAEVLAGNPNTMRITPGLAVLLAHRDRRNNLVGVQQVDLVTGRDLGIASGGRAAICALGPEDARICVITPDARMAILSASELKGRARIWIVRPGLRQDEAEQLQDAVQGRRARILHLPDSDQSEVTAVAQMFAGLPVICIPHEADLVGRPLLGRWHTGEGLGLHEELPAEGDRHAV